MKIEIVKRDPFIFCCSKVSIDEFAEMGEEIINVIPDKESVLEVYRLVRQYFIPFVTILDNNDDIEFLINPDGRDVSELIDFINKLQRDKTMCSTTKMLMTDCIEKIKGYRIANNAFQGELITLHGEMLIDAQNNVHSANENMIKLD